MTAIQWNAGINGTFDTASDWSTATIPGLNDDALIDASGASRSGVYRMRRLSPCPLLPVERWR